MAVWPRSGHKCSTAIRNRNLGTRESGAKHPTKKIIIMFSESSY